MPARSTTVESVPALEEAGAIAAIIARPSPAPDTVWDRLRAPFADSEIGKLHRYTGGKNTPKSERDYHTCDVCGKYHDHPSIHIDYVGHAEITDRLLQADPLWNWEPLAWDDVGLPMVTHRGGTAELWIRLTVGEVTRLGVGTVPLDKDDVVKQLIGDALRNAAMRFGVALDLWKKGTGDDDNDRPAAGPPSGPVERPCPACGHNVTDNRKAHDADSQKPAWRCSNRACTGGNNDRPWASWNPTKVPESWGLGIDGNSGAVNGDLAPPTPPPPPRNPVFDAMRQVLEAVMRRDRVDEVTDELKAAARIIWNAASGQFGYDPDAADIPADQIPAILTAALDMVTPSP